MSVDVTVCTPSLPERGRQLAEAIASVVHQTVRPAAHLIWIESPGPGQEGPRHMALQRNRLLLAVTTKWTAVLDDDDL